MSYVAMCDKWKYVDEIFSKPAFSFVGSPCLEEIDSEKSSQGVWCTMILSVSCFVLYIPLVRVYIGYGVANSSLRVWCVILRFMYPRLVWIVCTIYYYASARKCIARGVVLRTGILRFMYVSAVILYRVVANSTQGVCYRYHIISYDIISYHISIYLTFYVLLYNSTAVQYCCMHRLGNASQRGGGVLFCA